MSKQKTAGKTARDTKHQQETLTVINADGTTRPCQASWDAARSAIKAATLSPLILSDGGCLLVDDDGRPKNLEINPWASEIAEIELVGAVVLVPRHCVKKMLGVTPDSLLKRQKAFQSWLMSVAQGDDETACDAMGG